MPRKRLSAEERLKRNRAHAAKVRAARDSHDFLTIQPGCLYYDISEDTPIGNKAKRAKEKGLRADELKPITPPWYGCNRMGTTRAGMRIAFNSEFCREYYHAK